MLSGTVMPFLSRGHFESLLPGFRSRGFVNCQEWMVWQASARVLFRILSASSF